MIRISRCMRQKFKLAGVLPDEIEIRQHRAGETAGRGIAEQVGVDGRMAHPAGRQGVIESLNVDKLAAIIIDQHRATVHAAQDISADKAGIGVAAGMRVLLAQTDMNAEHIGAFSRIAEVWREGKALGFHPVPVPRACVDHHAHAEGAGELGDLATDIAVTDDRDRLAFELLGWEIAQFPAGVEGTARHPLMKRVDREVRQHFQDRLHHHLRRGTAVDARRVHQHRGAALAAAATPGARAHIAGAGTDPHAGQRKDGFRGKESRGGDDGVIAPVAGGFDQLFAGAEVRLVKKMHSAMLKTRFVAKRGQMEAATLGLDVGAHCALVGLAVRAEAQADQIANQHGVGALRIDWVRGLCIGVRCHVVSPCKDGKACRYSGTL